ncbi:hypothetical protein [Kribbella sp. CA-247076]|uniref:hypothetical protein n=1 Tax=Kribbella sp. CA-247076 TaxID=3239941 RepID=UPI003D8C7842
MISQGPGTGSLGMKVDRKGRLFVAGAAGGNGRVKPVFYKVPLGRHGKLPAQSAVRTIAYTGEYRHGLLVIGTTLYVVQNRLNRIAVLKLNPSGTRGRLVDRITSPDFDVPTTAAAFGNRLYLRNARFNVQPPLPTTPYWVTAVER